MQGIDPAQYRPDEDVYYNDGYVWVTNRRVVHSGGEISLKRARGLCTRRVRAEDRFRDQIILYLWGIGVLLLTMFSPLYTIRGGSFLDVVPLIVQILLAVTLVLVIGQFIALLVNRNKLPREPIYTASVRYRYWSRIVVASTDRAYVERIAEAIVYVIASRNGTAYVMPIPTSIGRSVRVPSPIIRGNTLYTGQATYGLAEIRSANVYTMQELSAERIVWLGLLTIGVFSDYASRYLEAPWSTYASIIKQVSIMVFGVTVLFGPADTWARVHMVQITLHSGTRAIVFASTSKADARQVKQSINESRRLEAALQTSQDAYH